MLTQNTKKESGDIKYFEAVGRRKTSRARVRISKSKDLSFSINELGLKNYFPTEELQNIVKGPFEKLKIEKGFFVSVRVLGGGIKSQAEAVRHGISRALIKINPDFRQVLKEEGFLKRDPRMKERRKFGLKKARKAPQWSKR